MCQNVSKKPFLAILSDFGGFWVSFLHFLAHLKPQITYIDVFWAEKSIQHIFGTIRRCLRALFDIFNLFWRFWPKPPNLPLWWGYLRQGLKFRKKMADWHGTARHGLPKNADWHGTARHGLQNVVARHGTRHESSKSQNSLGVRTNQIFGTLTVTLKWCTVQYVWLLRIIKDFILGNFHSTKEILDMDPSS